MEIFHFACEAIRRDLNISGGELRISGKHVRISGMKTENIRLESERIRRQTESIRRVSVSGECPEKSEDIRPKPKKKQWFFHYLEVRVSGGREMFGWFW